MSELNFDNSEYTETIRRLDKFVESSSKDQISRNFIRELKDGVFAGDPDLRIYNLESILARNSGDEFLKLQLEFARSLPDKERSWLIERIPKGAWVEFEIETYWNGNSIKAIQNMEKLLGQEGVWVLDTDNIDEVPQDIEGLKAAPKLSKEEAKKEFEVNFPKGPTVITTVKGLIEAEPIQGFGGIRIIDDKGEQVAIDQRDVRSFALIGVDVKAAKRRPNEIYPDRVVRVLDNASNDWVDGTVLERALADQLRVKLSRPVKTSSILGVSSTVDMLTVNIGIPPDYEFRKELPEIGSSDIETKPWLFENIDFNLDGKTNLDKVPEVFRRGNLVIANGKIFEVGKVSSQGFAQMSNIGNSIYDKPEIVYWSEMEELPELLTNSSLSPEIVDYESKIKNSRILISTRELGYKSGYGDNVIVAVEGIYNIDNTLQVLLKSLPVFEGSKANIAPFIYKPVSLEEFNRWNQEGLIQISGTNVVSELKEKFPERFSDILKYLDKNDGSVVAVITMIDGRVDNGSINLASLPFGIWKVFGAGNAPHLYSLDEIADIKPYDWLSELW